MSNIRQHLKLLLGIAICLLSGCSATLNVVNYPGFFSSSDTYSSVAVANVVNNVDGYSYTNQLNADIVNGLRKNGYYSVSDYTHENATDEELLINLSENNSADLAIFSTLTDYGENYDSHIETETKEEVYYALDEDGYTIYDDYGNPVVDHVEEYEVEHTVYERTSYASMTVIIIDMETGAAVYDNSKDGSCYEEYTDYPMFSSEDSGRWCAIDKAVAKQIYQICPTYEQVTVDKDEVLGIYRHGDEGWEEETKFGISDQMKLAFWFPKAAYYNTFKFDIVYGSDDIVVASEHVYWEGKKLSFDYDIADLVDASNGAEKFTIRLWNGKNIAFDKTIKVK